MQPMFLLEKLLCLLTVVIKPVLMLSLVEAESLECCGVHSVTGGSPAVLSVVCDLNIFAFSAISSMSCCLILAFLRREMFKRLGAFFPWGLLLGWSFMRNTISRLSVQQSAPYMLLVTRTSCLSGFLVMKKSIRCQWPERRYIQVVLLRSGRRKIVLVISRCSVGVQRKTAGVGDH